MSGGLGRRNLHSRDLVGRFFALLRRGAPAGSPEGMRRAFGARRIFAGASFAWGFGVSRPPLRGGFADGFRKPEFAVCEAVCGVVCQFRFFPSSLQGAARGDISANRRICAKAFRQCVRLRRIVRLKLLAVVLNCVSRKARVGSGEAESRCPCGRNGVPSGVDLPAICTLPVHAVPRLHAAKSVFARGAAYSGRDSNPYGQRPADFKSAASTIPPPEPNCLFPKRLPVLRRAACPPDKRILKLEYSKNPPQIKAFLAGRR